MSPCSTGEMHAGSWSKRHPIGLSLQTDLETDLSVHTWWRPSWDTGWTTSASNTWCSTAQRTPNPNHRKDKWHWTKTSQKPSASQNERDRGISRLTTWTKNTRVCVCVWYGQQVAHDSDQTTGHIEVWESCHTSGVIKAHLYTLPHFSVFSSFLIAGATQENDCLFSDPKLIANVKMNPLFSLSLSHSLAVTHGNSFSFL